MLARYNTVCNIQRLYRFKIDKLRTGDTLPIDVAAEILPMYQKIIEFQAKAIVHLGKSSIKRAWQGTWGSIDWKGMQSEVVTQQAVCDQFFQSLTETETQNLMRDAQNLFEQETEQLRQSVQIQNQIGSTLMQMLDIQKNMRYDEEVEEILKHLNSTYSVGKSRCGKRLEGTGEWFSTQDDFKHFRDAQGSRLFWLFGEPGSGKSVLSRWLIDDQLLRTNVMTTTVNYFFFHDDLKEQPDGTEALQALIHQILTSPPTAHLASKLIKRPRFPTALSELWSLLLELAEDEDAGEVFCILDALDECQEASRKELRDLIISYYKEVDVNATDASKLKFLITSRPILELKNRVIHELKDHQAFFSVDSRDYAAALANDINVFISHEIARFYPNWHQSERNELIKCLQHMDNKTYLWLHLTFDLMDKAEPEYLTLQTAQEAMSKVPSTVAEAYEKMLKRASNERYARLILELILAAQRPLTVDEVNIAFSILVSPSIKSLDSLRRGIYPPHEFYHNVQEFCGFLVEVYDSKVYFVHQTAKEFLLENLHPENIIAGSKWQYSFTSEEFNGTLARCCLEFLLLWEDCRRSDEDDADLGLDDDEDADSLEIPCEDGIERDGSLKAFLQYASRYWPIDLHQSSSKHQQALLEKALAVCEPLNIARDDDNPWWFQICVDSLLNVESRNLGVMNPELWTKFGIACVVGSAEAAKELLAQSNASDKLIQTNILNIGTPFEVAIVFGHDNILELILQHSSSVKKSSGLATSLLTKAFNEGNIRAIEILIDHGADPNTTVVNPFNKRKHILPFIAGAGSLDLLRRVLKICHGKLDSRWASSALNTAIFSGDYTVQRLDVLVEAGADVNATGLYGDHVLASAARANDIPALKHLLLKLKVNKAVQGPPALCAAASKGNLKISKMLVQKLGVDVNARPDYQGFKSVQGAAARGGNTEVFRLVTNSSTDWNVCGGEALYGAAIKGHLAIVRILLEEMHVDANAQEAGSREPVAAATALRGNASVLKYLLAKGARLPNPGRALKKALLEGQYEAARVLLQDTHADPNHEVHSLFYWSILGSAAYSGKPDMVQLLIDHGVDMVAYGPAALASALLKTTAFDTEGMHRDEGMLETIQKLLDNGVSPNSVIKAEGRFGSDQVNDVSMLECAAVSCYRDALILVVENGVDLVSFGPKAICAAIKNPVQYQHTEEAIRKTVKLLLDAGLKQNIVYSDQDFTEAGCLAASEGMPDVLQELWKRNAPSNDALLQALSRALEMRAAVFAIVGGLEFREDDMEFQWRANRRYRRTIKTLMEEIDKRKIVQQAHFIGTDGIARPFKVHDELGRYWLRILAGGKYAEDIYLDHLELPGQKSPMLVVSTYQRVMVVRTNELQIEWGSPLSQIDGTNTEPDGERISLRNEDEGHLITVQDEDIKINLHKMIVTALNKYLNHGKEEAP